MWRNWWRVYYRPVSQYMINVFNVVFLNKLHICIWLDFPEYILFLKWPWVRCHSKHKWRNWFPILPPFFSPVLNYYQLFPKFSILFNWSWSKSSIFWPFLNFSQMLSTFCNFNISRYCSNYWLQKPSMGSTSCAAGWALPRQLRICFETRFIRSVWNLPTQ